MNAYRYEEHYEICMDLAGVSHESIDLRVEPHRLTIRGTRHPPEQKQAEASCQQILALEIESGEFTRQIDFQVAVDPDGVDARQENGLLWIRLPLRSAP